MVPTCSGGLPSNSRLQTRSQDGEGGSEDAQFHVSDVPYLNMARGHIKFI